MVRPKVAFLPVVTLVEKVEAEIEDQRPLDSRVGKLICSPVQELLGHAGSHEPFVEPVIARVVFQAVEVNCMNQPALDRWPDEGVATNLLVSGYKFPNLL